MNNRIILLIEDNPDERELTLISLENSDISHELVVVQNATEALDYLFATGAYIERDLSKMPRLILVDLNLPGVSGVEFLRRVRSDRRTQYLPVVIMSGSIEPENLIESYRFRCNSYIRKPIDFTQFQDTLAKIAMYWLTINEVPPVE